MKRLPSVPILALALLSCQQPLHPDGSASLSSTAVIMGTTTRINPAPFIPGFPAISGDRIVWQGSTGFGDDIFMFDLNTRALTQLTADAYWQRWPGVCHYRAPARGTV